MRGGALGPSHPTFQAGRAGQGGVPARAALRWLWRALALLLVALPVPGAADEPAPDEPAAADPASNPASNPASPPPSVRAAIPARAWLFPSALQGATGTERASLAQTILWLEEGELAKALTLTRRATRELPDGPLADPAWHLLRLEALDVTGMTPWITEAYGSATRRRATAEVGYAAFVTGRGGETPALPEGEDGGLLLRLAEARAALLRGDVDGVRAVLPALDRDGARAVSLTLAALSGDEDAALAVVAGWSPGEPVAPLAALFDLPARGALNKARKAVVAAARAAVDAPAEGRLDAARLLLAARDAEGLAALHARDHGHEGKRPGEALQKLLDELHEGPSALSAWEIPPRPRWTAAEMAAEAKRLAREVTPTLPWLRPDEAAVFVPLLADRLTAAGMVAEADAVRERGLGPCAPTSEVRRLLAAGDARGARTLALDKLLACLGLHDLVPTADPAGIDHAARLDRFGAAWEAYGRYAAAAGKLGEAVVAMAVAARLAPTEPRVEAARDLYARLGPSERAAVPADATGVPTPAALAEALEAVGFLRPASAVAAARARVARARSIAMLVATPAALAEAATPMGGCLQTQRARCNVEHAVAAEAAARAGVALEGAERVGDRGAIAAAPLWLDALQQAWFTRRAALERFARVERAGRAAVGLDDVAAADVGLRLGGPAPRLDLPGMPASRLEGRVVVVCFWEAGRAAAEAALFVVDGWAARWKAAGLDVAVLAVNLDEDEARYRAAALALDLTYADLAHNPSLRASWEVSAVPTVAVVDARGVLRHLAVGSAGAPGELDAVVRAAAR
jgi:hypothetical protein